MFRLVSSRSQNVVYLSLLIMAYLYASGCLAGVSKKDDARIPFSIATRRVSLHIFVCLFVIDIASAAFGLRCSSSVVGGRSGWLTRAVLARKQTSAIRAGISQGPHDAGGKLYIS